MSKRSKCQRDLTEAEHKARLLTMIEYLLPDIEFYCPLAASIMECAIVALKLNFLQDGQLKLKWQPQKPAS